MAIPRIISDFAGTARTIIKVGLTSAGAALKAVTGGFVVRDIGDTADAPLTASELRASGDEIKLNSDAAGAGADWELTLARPAAGMAGDVRFTFPPDEGSPNQVLQTDGSGNATWATPAAGASNGTLVDVTALAFGDSSPVAMFTKPANSYVSKVEVVIDTPFDGAAPTVSIGISGTTSKYVASNQVDLTASAGTVFDVTPGEAVTVGTEALIATYNADGSTAGAARILTYYAQPS